MQKRASNDYWISHSKKVRVHKNGLVMMVGASCSGKTHIARLLFGENNIVSSDKCREMISGDPYDMSSNREAFDMMRAIIRKRLKRNLLTVIDCTNYNQDDRKGWIDFAAEECVPLSLILVETPLHVCLERAEKKGIHPRIIKKHCRTIKECAYRIANGHEVKTRSVVSGNAAEPPELEMIPNRTDMNAESGPFDMIGDLHGCYDQLVSLIGSLGYQDLVHPLGRRLVFLGDFFDRGPDSDRVVDLVMDACKAGHFAVPGNHDMNFLAVMNKDRKASGQSKETVKAIAERRGEEWLSKAALFISSLPGHIMFDGHKLVACHAGLPEFYHLRDSSTSRFIASYGPWEGARDDYGYKHPGEWQRQYEGAPLVVYGHTVFEAPCRTGNTIGIDTGCVFGGKLTAFRYPEMDFVQVDGLDESSRHDLGMPWKKSIPPLADGIGAWQPRETTVSTRYGMSVTIPAEQASDAFYDRFAGTIDQSSLFYMPGTMSPGDAAPAGCEFLERPEEAIDYYRRAGVHELVMQEKHMGSRAVVIVGPGCGRVGPPATVMTRYGRPFFKGGLQESLIRKVQEDLLRGGFWDGDPDGWSVIDCELLPWSAKASGLLANQYVMTGEAGLRFVPNSIGALESAIARGVVSDELPAMLGRMRGRLGNITEFKNAYSRYCWPTDGLDGILLAPFAMLCHNGKATFDMDYEDLGRKIARCVFDGGIIKPTNSHYFYTDATGTAIDFWRDLTSGGGEGVVLKPRRLLARTDGYHVQPGLKVRGREYLRIIYGPDYTDNIESLRHRGVVPKQKQAIKQFLLGLEGVNRYLDGESVASFNQPAFAVMAMNHQKMDPRL